MTIILFPPYTIGNGRSTVSTSSLACGGGGGGAGAGGGRSAVGKSRSQEGMSLKMSSRHPGSWSVTPGSNVDMSETGNTEPVLVGAGTDGAGSTCDCVSSDPKNYTATSIISQRHVQSERNVSSATFHGLYKVNELTVRFSSVQFKKCTKAQIPLHRLSPKLPRGESRGHKW